MEIQSNGMCKCGKNPKSEPHTCPYKKEIGDDYESLCECCPECEQECKDEI